MDNNIFDRFYRRDQDFLCSTLGWTSGPIPTINTERSLKQLNLAGSITILCPLNNLACKKAGQGSWHMIITTAKNPV